MRSRAVPRGMVGYRIAGIKKPLLRRESDAASANLFSPIILGIIGVGEPKESEYVLRRPRLSIPSGEFKRSRAARLAAACEGGGAVVEGRQGEEEERWIV